MVINSMLVYRFVDPDLKGEIFIEDEGAAEKRSTDFEIGDIGTSGYLYWGLNKISCRASLPYY